MIASTWLCWSSLSALRPGTGVAMGGVGAMGAVIAGIVSEVPGADAALNAPAAIAIRKANAAAARIFISNSPQPRSWTSLFRNFIGHDIIGAKPCRRSGLQLYLSPRRLDAGVVVVAFAEESLRGGKLGHWLIAGQRVGASECAVPGAHVGIGLHG